MTINVLTICGSPIKGGNSEMYTREAIKAVEDMPDVETELVLLSKWKFLRGCNHCNFCATKQKPTRFCSIDDEMSEVYPKLLEADAIVISSPAYVLRMTGLMANFLDRLRPLYHGKHYVTSLTDKVGSAVVVAFGRHAGVETTQLSIVHAFLMWGVIPVTLGLFGPFGAGGVSSYHGEAKVDPDDRLAVLKDNFGVKEAKILYRNLVEKARLIKAGREALNIENKFLKFYQEGLSSQDS